MKFASHCFFTFSQMDGIAVAAAARTRYPGTLFTVLALLHAPRLTQTSECPEPLSPSSTFNNINFEEKPLHASSFV